MSDILIEKLRNQAGRLEVGIGSVSECIACMKEAAELLEKSEKIIAEIVEASQDAHDELVHGCIDCNIAGISILKERILDKPWIKTPE